MTTRAEEIAGPYKVERSALADDQWQVRGADGMPILTIRAKWDAEAVCKAMNMAYKQGQQDRWIPVAMIHNDYDASVRCSNCGDTGGFGAYDDLEWAKHCPGCGRPISEQVSAKGVRTPHPLYTPPNPEQR